MIDIENYTDLAWYHANSSNKKHLQGVELDDLYQHAMIGIWTASLAYEKEKGSFTAYAYKYIQGEINTLIYKKIGGQRVPRVAETLIEDIDTDEDCMSQMLYVDSVEDDEFLIKYLATLSLPSKHKKYFTDLLMHGEEEATRLYIAKHEVSRQRAYQVKQKVREVTQRHLRRLT